MNKKLYSFFAVMGMAIAMGAAAFTAPKENVNDNGLLWFVKQADGSYSQESTAPSDCPEIETDAICALGFEEMPTLPVTDSSPTPHKRYIDEN